MIKQIIFLCLILTIYTDDVNNSINKPKDCSFYKEYLEEKFKCGSNGYPIGYGFKYCNRFLEYFSNFSSTGKQWVEDTLVCLKQKLVVPYNTFDEKNKDTCDKIKNYAFDSHVQCYVSNGFCEELKRSPIQFSLDLFKVYQLKDFLSLLAIKQIKDVMASCL